VLEKQRSTSGQPQFNRTAGGQMNPGQAGRQRGGVVRNHEIAAVHQARKIHATLMHHVT